MAVAKVLCGQTRNGVVYPVPASDILPDGSLPARTANIRLSRGFGLADFVTYFTTEGRFTGDGPPPVISMENPPLSGSTTDYHTAGEPFRIVSGVGPIPGDTVLDKRAWAPENLDHSGIVGTRFAGRVVEEAEVAGVPAVITEVEGSAQLTGHHHFVLERDDPLGPGFLLR